MKFNPKHNHVILEPVEFKDTKVGNIIVPDIDKEMPRTARVLAVGIGTYTLMGELIPMECKVGELVYYPPFGGQKITINGKEFIAMKDIDIITSFEQDEVSN